MTRSVSRLLRSAVGAAVLAPVAVLFVAAPAAAHPLGNFTISHYDGVTLRPDRVDVLSVVDRAEIPTVQLMPSVDVDGDGIPSPAELTAAAQRECPALTDAVTLRAAGSRLALEVVEASMSVLTGAASLPTLRLTCRSSAPVDLTEATTVTFSDDYLADRVGWREVTAIGDGVTLVDPAVPAASISDELRDYPQDLLASPLRISDVDLAVTPGGPGGGAAGAVLGAPSSDDPVGRFVAAGDDWLQSLVAAPELTVWVGALAVLLAAVLGAGHALLPGHGKTVMAAYLAGRRGRRRDALVVGATVTLTHTVGVLVVGLLLTVASAIAGDDVLGLLGVVSGLLVAAVGAALLRDAWRDRRHQRMTGSPGDSHRHDPALAAAPAYGTWGATLTETRRVAAPGQPATRSGVPAHETHDHETHDHETHDHASHDRGHHHPPHEPGGHGHGDHSHSHGHGPGHSHGFGKRGLIGLGVAGGLVPSPSALVVLLGAIALGRTVFGVLLVLAYGLGMAATLTAVGLLLVHAQRRLSRLDARGRLAGVLARAQPLLPVLTACLVIVVGLGLALRSAA